MWEKNITNFMMANKTSKKVWTILCDHPDMLQQVKARKLRYFDTLHIMTDALLKAQ